MMARCAASLVGVNDHTAAYYFHQQEAYNAFGAFWGEIEVAESYFGGVRIG